MQKLKKHIAVFLLLVFSLASAPPALWHKAFANHVDTEDNYCDFYHKDLGTHVEGSHTSCDILKTQTLLYDALNVENTVSVFRIIISQHTISNFSADFSSFEIRLPARAPPIA